MEQKIIVSILLFLVLGCTCILLISASQPTEDVNGEKYITSGCNYEVIESMPEGMDFKQQENNIEFESTADALLQLINGAKKSIKIASFYWSLSGLSDYQPGNDDHDIAPGKSILSAILDAAKLRNIKVEIVTDKSHNRSMSFDEDLKTLEKVTNMKYLNMKNFFGKDGGVLHTKFVLVDEDSFYLGSSNMDWRSYTQIKEIGILITQCPVLSEDLDKVFRTYQLMADNQKLPDEIPQELYTNINMQNPLIMSTLDEDSSRKTMVYMGASPPAFNSGKSHKWSGRTDDIDALISIIRNARKFVYVSVMNYSPIFEYRSPKSFWPVIDDELRKAATERNVRVKLLFSDWPTHNKPNAESWYKSLDAYRLKHYGGSKAGSIQVNMFLVPTLNDHQKKIPFARVKHDKYMVSDYGVYIGTSNWEPSYFTGTCGVGFVAIPAEGEQTKSNSRDKKGRSLVNDMKQLFERDFYSPYSTPLSTPVDSNPIPGSDNQHKTTKDTNFI